MKSNDMVFPESNAYFLTLDNFQALKSAIFDKNLDKEIQYKAAIILADRIYDYNFYRIRATLGKECKSPSCIDKAEIYKNDTLEIKNEILDPIYSTIIDVREEYKAPIEKIRLVLNQAVNQEEDLLYRFLAASTMPYIRENPSKDIINILAETFINPTGILNPNCEEDSENSNLIKQVALDSLQLFSKYADDSSYFEDISPDLNRLIMSEDSAHTRFKLEPNRAANGPDAIIAVVVDLWPKRGPKPHAIIDRTRPTSGRK